MLKPLAQPRSTAGPEHRYPRNHRPRHDRSAGHASDGSSWPRSRSVGTRPADRSAHQRAWGDVEALWLSTDQWLVICARAKAVELTAALRAELGSIHSLIVDVSDMRAILRLEGEGYAILLKGSSLDLLSDDMRQAPCAACGMRKLRHCYMLWRLMFSMFTCSALTRITRGILSWQRLENP